MGVSVGTVVSEEVGVWVDSEMDADSVASAMDVFATAVGDGLVSEGTAAAIVTDPVSDCAALWGIGLAVHAVSASSTAAIKRKELAFIPSFYQWS